jgi:hypothetical protein
LESLVPFRAFAGKHESSVGRLACLSGIAWSKSPSQRNGEKKAAFAMNAA